MTSVLDLIKQKTADWLHVFQRSASSDLTLMFSTAPPVDLEGPFSKGSRRPENSGAMMSNSLLTYAYIKGTHHLHGCTHTHSAFLHLLPPLPHTEHPEMAALLFTSSVCIGLLLTLLAVSVRVTCRGHRLTDGRAAAKPCIQEEDEEEEDGSDEEEGTDSSLISAADRKAIYNWEEVTYVSEAAERAERIERREMIIQEIWMNAYLNGSSI